jgi:hypothetical protein
MSLILREEREVQVFENRVCRKIFEPKRDVVRGQFRILHIVELSYLYRIPTVVRLMK